MSGFTDDMANSSFSYSEFTPVKARKRRKNRPEHRERPSLSMLLQYTRDDISQHNEWFSQCQSIVKSSLKPSFHGSQPSVLCLGLGSPSSSPISRAQLAFMIELCGALGIDNAKVSIYDPVFTLEDLDLFKKLRFQVLSENRNAGYPLREPTICYMPHCDMEMYNNLLRANWSKDQIVTLILVANRLEEYLENNPRHKLQERVPFLVKTAPILACHPLPPSEKWPAAFNNSAVQYVHSAMDLHDWLSQSPDAAQGS